MTTTLKYSGTSKPFFETAITGKARSWMPGQQQDVGDADAVALCAAGGFTLPATRGVTWIPLGGNYTLTADDDQKAFACTAVLTLTVPAALSPRPSVALLPPPSGNLTVTGPIGGTSVVSPTRARSGNAAGVALTPWPDVDAYGLAGA